MIKNWFSQERLLVFIQAASLLFLVLFLYSPTVNYDFIWDDQQHIQASQHLGSIDGLKKIWFSPGATSQYYPVTFTALWVLHHFFGLNPAAFHLFNILIHSLNAIGILLILRRLQVPAAFGAALIFALHPIQVETVAWALEAKNLLSTFFYGAALFCYLESEMNQRRGFYVASWLLFCLALLSKSVVATFPLAVLLILWWKKGRVTLTDVLSLIPFFVMSAALGFMTSSLEKFRIGAVGPEWDLPIGERFAIAGRVVWFYVGTRTICRYLSPTVL